jgi:hypothetical protein
MCDFRLTFGGRVAQSGRGSGRWMRSMSRVVSWVLSEREVSVDRRDQVSCRQKENVDLRGCWLGVGNVKARALEDRLDASVGWMEEQIRGDGEWAMCRAVLEAMHGRQQHH